VGHREHLVLRQLGELDVDALEPGEGPLAADEQRREIRQAVEVVARDAPRHFREARVDLVLLAREKRRGAIGDLRDARIRRRKAEATAHAGGQPRIDGAHAVDHVAVGERARAARVVAAHAADRGLRRGGDVDREPHALRAQLRVERVEDHARLDHRAARLGIDLEHAIEVAAVVDDERLADGLPALRGAGAARQHRDALLDGDLHRDDRRVHGARDHHAHRRHLVDRRVGRVARAARGVEQDLAVDLAREAPRERRSLGAAGETHGRSRGMGHGSFYRRACQTGSRCGIMEEVLRRKPCPPVDISCRFPDRPTFPIGSCAPIDRPTIDHRGPEFQALAKDVLEGMKRVFRTRHPW
jgi:hypothetical protein